MCDESAKDAAQNDVASASEQARAETDRRVGEDVAYYGSLVQGWLDTRLELDKSILTLSTAGLGFLIVMPTQGGITGVAIFTLFIFALLAFLTAIIAVLAVLRGNSTHLQNVLANHEAENTLLATLDKVSIAGFLVGVMCSIILGISVAAHSFLKSEVGMSEKPKSEQGSLNESFQGVGGLKSPRKDPAASANGIQNMRPIERPGQGPDKKPDTKK